MREVREEVYWGVHLAVYSEVYWGVDSESLWAGFSAVGSPVRDAVRQDFNLFTENRDEEN